MSSSSNHTDGNPVLSIQSRQLPLSRPGFDVPVMQETLLLLELEAQEFSIDLRALSQLVLSDLGATLQLLRLAGCEYDNADGRPTRIEDCISYLGVQTCIEALSAQLVPKGWRSKAIVELWSHSREIARHSKHIAAQTADIDPDQAYLVGLCHSIGSLPAVLGWGGNKSHGFDNVSEGAELSRKWSLPCCVLDYFCELQTSRQSSSWQEIVRAAHQRAGQPSLECTSREDLRPRLLRAV